MPKLAIETVRREAMIEATIAEIGQTGRLDIPVSQIAKRAGISPALALHYFKTKDAILLAAMRHILQGYAEAIAQAQASITEPEERIRAIIATSLRPEVFEPETIAAWLNFYILSLHSSEAKRLLRVYIFRLYSNLVSELGKLFDDATARRIAKGLAALIDGFYLRQALQERTPDRAEVQAVVDQYLDLWLERKDLHARA